jgi:hypothetical protein
MATKILLATTVRWPSAGRFAGAFAATGCAVDAIMPTGHPAARSRHFSRRYAYWPVAGMSSFVRAIARSQPDFVVALDDRATSLLLDVHRRAQFSNPGIADLVRRSLGNVASYPFLTSRAGFIQSACEADILAPQTHLMTSETALESALAQTGFPAVLKTDGTWGGDGVAVIHNREAALRTFTKLAHTPSRLRSIARAIRRRDSHHMLAAIRPHREMVSLQKFVPGTPATTAFACWQGKVLAAIHFEAVATQGDNGPASVLRRIDCVQMDDAANRLAQRFELSGLHGLDYVRDADGKMHLIEINPRAPQSAYLAFGPHHDLTTALVTKLRDRPVAARPRIASDVVALFPQEWMRDPASDYLKSAYHDVPWEDPELIRSWLLSPAAQSFRRKVGSLEAGTDSMDAFADTLAKLETSASQVSRSTLR